MTASQLQCQHSYLYNFALGKYECIYCGKELTELEFVKFLDDKEQQ